MVNSFYVWLRFGVGHFVSVHRRDKKYHVYEKITKSSYDRLEYLAKKQSKMENWLCGRNGNTSYSLIILRKAWK